MNRESPESQKHRRRFSKAYKRQVVEQTFEKGALVSLVAHRHDITTAQIYKWQKLYRQGQLTDVLESKGEMPLQVFLQGSAFTSPRVSESNSDATPPDELVIALSNGHSLVLRGRVDTAALRVVLDMLS
ncbi:transposase [Chromohalobacter sp. 296-RDG]|uniref:IS66-like element accessory protein TnpA n=1 Tax=Chromohalobacter sp. 296-RDG TaxID=2994062 RepID=UPI002469C138|nr:transposase [Chromohalobacter sp. 296-RDG]